jgi:hypothetical protein
MSGVTSASLIWGFLEAVAATKAFHLGRNSVLPGLSTSVPDHCRSCINSGSVSFQRPSVAPISTDGISFTIMRASSTLKSGLGRAGFGLAARGFACAFGWIVFDWPGFGSPPFDCAVTSIKPEYPNKQVSSSPPATRP